MKLKTRLTIASIISVILPVVLTIIAALGLGNFHLKTLEREYGYTGTLYESIFDSSKMLTGLTEESYIELTQIVETDPDIFKDAEFNDKLNLKLYDIGAYLIVRQGDVVTYIGNETSYQQLKREGLPVHTDAEFNSLIGVQYGGDLQLHVRQIDYIDSSDVHSSVFIVENIGGIAPETKEYLTAVLFAAFAALTIAAGALVFWLHQSMTKPLKKMSRAALNIKAGKYDFELLSDVDDEIGQLYKDFNTMRLQLKESNEEKAAYDDESRELIANITHDLKTPITAIKGYAEGIMDGITDTEEKREKYIRTIYNKASELDVLINELTNYSSVERNRIEFDFKVLSITEYFDNWAGNLQLELEASGIEFGYYNYVEAGQFMRVDSEQMSRVLHNIVNNAVKYSDKAKTCINLRIKEVGEYIQVEVEDNGKGIAQDELPYIFDRFYRADASRNTAQGGSGIGLSIVKKILDEHDSKVWVSSKKNVGTVIYFVLKKYQEGSYE